jgi:hypothetical protein
MSIVNNFTTQKPLTILGSTGNQVLNAIPASRVFIKAVDSLTATPIDTYTAYTFKTNGATPTGWSDAGIMDTPGKLTYKKNEKKVTTGIDKVIRAVYSESKEASIDITLVQMDDYLLSLLGFNGSVATAGSSMNFLVGQEDIIQKALLCVYSNKLDGKEFHVYHPAAYLNCTFDMASDKMVVKVSAELVPFTPATGPSVEALYALNIFA